MGFRFRLGPFTFGRSGVRLSIWGGGSGISVPLSGKGRTFGKIGLGPLSWHGHADAKQHPQTSEGRIPAAQPRALSHAEESAISALRADRHLLARLRQNGVPWRGVQERLREALPQDLPDHDRIAYELVPIAMATVFGPQGKAWTTEKRPAKDGSGTTTWIIIT